MADTLELDGWIAGPAADDGAVRRVGDRFELRLVREIARPIEKVWAALTVPERIADWLGDSEIELRVGGRYVIHLRDEPNFIEGIITACQPPRLLEYNWTNADGGPSTVRLDLTPESQACRLVFTQTRMLGRRLIDTASGWHDFLDLIQIAADGRRAEHDHERWRATDDRYRAWLGPLVAESPS
ncbi:MAG TPA: SRPBCC family protein [Caulobacteraceae bacterium]